MLSQNNKKKTNHDPKYPSNNIKIEDHFITESENQENRNLPKSSDRLQINFIENKSPITLTNFYKSNIPLNNNYFPQPLGTEIKAIEYRNTSKNFYNQKKLLTNFPKKVKFEDKTVSNEPPLKFNGEVNKSSNNINKDFKSANNENASSYNENKKNNENSNNKKNSTKSKKIKLNISTKSVDLDFKLNSENKIAQNIQEKEIDKNNYVSCLNLNKEKNNFARNSEQLYSKNNILNNTKDHNEKLIFNGLKVDHEKFIETENRNNKKLKFSFNRNYINFPDDTPKNDFEKLLFSTRKNKMSLNLNNNQNFKANEKDLKFPFIFATPRQKENQKFNSIYYDTKENEDSNADKNLKYKLKVYSSFKNKMFDNMELSIIRFSQMNGEKKNI